MSKQNAAAEFWFYIDSYVHISQKNDWVLLYNPLNARVLEYRHQPGIALLVKRLRRPRNLAVIKLKAADMANPEIAEFIREVRSNFMGDVISVASSGGKPVQLAPQVVIEKDVRRLKNRDLRSVGQDIMRYLSELTLYITNDCGAGCLECGDAWRQFICCTARPGGKPVNELNISDIDAIFNQIGGSQLVNINILGGDIFRYYALEELFERLHLLPMHKTLFLHYKNVRQPRWSFLKALMQADKNALLKMFVTFPMDEKRLTDVAQDLKNSGLLQATRFLFIISDEEQFAQAEAFIEKFGLAGVSFHPWYNGDNLIFFAANIFTGRNDIIDAKPNWNYIHVRGEVNNLSFGRLYILSNGAMHAGVNAPRLGVLGKSSIFDVLMKEMETGRSWRRIRRRLDPCRKCVFEMLCPSISDYSCALKRNNLCTVWLPEFDEPKNETKE